jgi:hypothetical protein
MAHCSKPRVQGQCMLQVNACSMLLLCRGNTVPKEIVEPAINCVYVVIAHCSKPRVQGQCMLQVNACSMLLLCRGNTVPKEIVELTINCVYVVIAHCTKPWVQGSSMLDCRLLYWPLRAVEQPISQLYGMPSKNAGSRVQRSQVSFGA